MTQDMKRQFGDRAELLAYLKEQFPDATHPELVAEARGGRRAAMARLTHVVESGMIKRYASTRNALNGDVTRLSPWLRHGVLSLAEVRDVGLEWRAPDKFINELGWRDYWQRVYADIGNQIWVDLEPYKTGFSAEQYADQLPADIREGKTGTCIDLFINELIETGYIHNHARMWLAAYIVHWRRIKWQAGARWFLEHLLDGDPASNNLSWQWVASTFSHKPYFMNADNIRRYAKELYPHLLQRKLPPFEGTYPQLEARLFPHKPADQRQNQRKKQRGKQQQKRRK